MFPLAATRADEPLSYDREVRPILSNHCFRCHGFDEEKREADLRLDQREAAVAPRDEGSAIVPGEPDKSLIIERATTADESLRMPPPDHGPALTEKQVAILRRWIAEGASYDPHWSFQPIRRPPVPAVRDSAWLRQPLDAFVAARLEQHSLGGAPEADRVTLIRRLSLDLLGLPPTIEEVAEFVADTRVDAYERLVERLLTSPRFGERWGRHWLDEARYADSSGYSIDAPRVMWPYRDWVIGAFNDDLPFDQFTIEQLAGDLLGSPERHQLIATGFHRNTLINGEGGTKPDQFRVEQTKDRVDTTGVVWLGLTVGCANCHNHKFDPITQADYYRLYAFFDSTQDQNSVSPVVSVPTASQAGRLDALKAEVAAARKSLDEPDPDLAERRAAWESKLKAEGGDAPPVEWSLITPAIIESRYSAEMKMLEDGSVLVSGPNVADDRYTASGTTTIRQVRSIRLEALRHESLPQGGPGRADNGNFVLSKVGVIAHDGRQLQVVGARADHSQPKYDVTGALDNDPKTGWAINGSPEGGANHERWAEFTLSETIEVAEDARIVVVLEFHNGAAAYNLGRFRLLASDKPALDPQDARRALSAIVALPAEQRNAEQKRQLDEAFDSQDPRRRERKAELARVEKELKQLEQQIPTSMVLRELAEPRETHIQVRGDFLRPGERVEPGVPQSLPALSEGEGRRTRLDLARWLVDPQHPLTARVRVNRVWMHLFGRGLVETENDFGTQGSAPTHPELLDWLAAEFQQGGWSTKRLLRTIVTSATYRQSSHGRPELDQVDPRNLLLGRQNRIRVEAEIVRDLTLSACGLLSARVGGPSVFPPQPDGVYAFTQTKKDWRVSAGEDRYRRGMYTFFYRSAPHPMLSTFDVPKFNQTCTRRDRSNTPLQSLTMANDEALYEGARELARRVLQTPGGADERLATLWLRALSRSPTEAEAGVLRRYLDQQRDWFAAHADEAQQVAVPAPEEVPAAESAAWVATARLVINLDEFITRE